MRFVLKRPVKTRTSGSSKNRWQQPGHRLLALLTISAGMMLSSAIPASELQQIQALLKSQRYNEALILIETTIGKGASESTELLFAPVWKAGNQRVHLRPAGIQKTRREGHL